MIRRIALFAFALLVAAPLAAQAPAGLQLRVDRSTNVDDPDDVADVTITAQGSGYRVSTGPAVTAWNDRHEALTTRPLHFARSGAW